MKTNFHNKNFTLSLAFIMRFKLGNGLLKSHWYQVKNSSIKQMYQKSAQVKRNDILTSPRILRVFSRIFCRLIVRESVVPTLAPIPP